MNGKVEYTNLLNPALKLIQSINDEVKNFSKIGLDKYVNGQLDKLYTVNTFLHRHEKVRFDDIYFPIKAKYKELNTDFHNLQDVLEEYKYITLVGSAGSGKSTLTKFIFLRALRLRMKIPILLELRHLNDFDGGFTAYIKKQILFNSVKENEGILERTLLKGKFLFILDGFDELFSDSKHKLRKEIEDFVDKFSDNYFIISSRPGGGAERLERFYDFSVQKLETQEVEGFVDKMLDDEERKKRIIETIGDSEKKYQEYLGNPLLLSMFILAYESHPEIPKRISSFYRNVFDTLYSRHDGITKGGFRRERLTKLQKHDFEEVLKFFSYITFFKGEYLFTPEKIEKILTKIKIKKEYDFNVSDLISDLRTSISIIVQDGLEYQFPHRSMQEFFCVLFIKDLNEDQKERVYQKYIDLLTHKSHDSGEHFWNLCLEIDKEAFNRYFLISILQEFINKINSNDKYSISRDFIQELGIRIGRIGDRKSKNIPFQNTPFGIWYASPKIYFRHTISFSLKKWNKNNISINIIYNELLEIVEAPNFLQCLSKTNISALNGELNYHLVSIEKLWNRKLGSFFLKKGFIEKINIVYYRIIEIIKELEEQSRKDNLSTDELIDDI